MEIFRGEYKSPIGAIQLAASERGLINIWLPGQKYEPLHGSGKSDAIIKAGIAWLARYFASERPDLADLRLAPAGTDFQQTVWLRLRAIPYGETTSYGQIAKDIGGSPRAVGSAIGKNPLLIMVPCHRVIGANGGLTGFAAGLHCKRWLLSHEGYLSPTTKACG